MKVTITTKCNSTTFTNIKDVIVYPEGDINTGCYVSLEYINPKTSSKYYHIYTKPDSIKVEN